MDVAGARGADIKENNAYDIGGCYEATDAEKSKNTKIKRRVDGAWRGVGLTPRLQPYICKENSWLISTTRFGEIPPVLTWYHEEYRKYDKGNEKVRNVDPTDGIKKELVERKISCLAQGILLFFTSFCRGRFIGRVTSGRIVLDMVFIMLLLACRYQLLNVGRRLELVECSLDDTAGCGITNQDDRVRALDKMHCTCS